MNLIQTFNKFPTHETCVQFLEKIRWDSVPQCPYCSSINTNPSDKRHYCYNCNTSFSVTVGTIFHRTHIPLQKWFLAIVLLLDDHRKISSLQLAKEIEVNKNTAWRLSVRIRENLSQPEERLLILKIAETLNN